MSNPISLEKGQSMSEFVIAASFVLIPLFIIVPTVGKYIDMKQAAVSSARYATWEYSAHYVDLRDQPAGFSAINSRQLPKKSHLQVAKEAERRFYSDTSIKINTDKATIIIGASAPMLCAFAKDKCLKDKTKNPDSKIDSRLLVI